MNSIKSACLKLSESKQGFALDGWIFEFGKTNKSIYENN
ncbi:hypothetical protein CHFL109739_01755 [Chryseobacterium flavum]